MKITFSVLGRLLGAVLVLAFNPSVTHAQFVGTNMITIDGFFTDWTNNVYPQIDGSNAGAGAGSFDDITKFWSAMSTANGTSPASSGNLIQNVYYRFDTASNSKNNPKQNYWVQLNLGTAAAGLADHVLQFFVDDTATPIVSIALYQYGTPYPAMGAFTTGGFVAKVANYAVSGATNDPNAIGAWAILPSTTNTYSFEAKIPIGWFSSTYGGSITADGTGASMIASAVFTSGGSAGAVSTTKDILDDASGNTYNSQVSATTGSDSFVPNHPGGAAYSAAAAAATLTPVAGASNTITLTVSNINTTTKTIGKDTTFTGLHNVIISGYSAAPNGSYGSFSNVTLTTLSQTNSVNFVLGVATVPLILNKAASQTIGFSLPDLTYPVANNLTITPTAGAASQLVVTTPPSASTVAGVAFAQQPVVKIADQFGNVVTSGADATRVVTVALTTGSGTLSGTLTKTAAAGVADFSGQNLSINLVGADKVLTFTTTGGVITSTNTSPAFAITFAAASQLVVTTQPSASTVAGVAFATQPVVKIEDAFGNVVTSGTDATRVVTVALTTGSGTLSGTLTKTAVAGVADFSGQGLSINLVGTDKVLTMSATITAGARTTTTSPVFTITFAAASQLVVTTQPSASTVAGVAFAQQPVVKIEDAFGNVVTSGADSTVSVALTLTTGTGSLTGTATMNAVAGVADFTGKGLNINLVGTDKVLTATATVAAGTKTATTSPAFAITPGAINHFAISAISLPQTVGTAFIITTITAQDANNNTVTSFGSAVTFGGTAGVTGTSAAFTSGVLSGASVTPTVAGSSLTVTVDDGAGHTGSATITTVNKGSTSVVVASSKNPSGYQDSVTFTATLPAAATGSVVFLTNGAAFGSAVTLSSGSATSLSLTNLPRGTNAITAQYAGGNYLDSTTNLSGGQVVTNHPPVADVTMIYRTAGLRLKIAWSDVTTNWSDSPDGDPVTLSGINLVTTNHINLTTNSTYILYTNSPNVNDQITYTINDGQGGTNIGYVNILVNSSVTGTNSIVGITTGSTNVVKAYGIPGYNYILERATNLAPAVWIDVSTNAAATNGVINASDAFSDLGGTPPASAYYRLSWSP